MKKTLWCSMVLLVLGLVGPGPAAAQGWGGFMHWLNKLGPEFQGQGVSVFSSRFGRTLPGSENPDMRAMRVRVSASRSYTSNSDPAIAPAGSSITMWSVNPTLEYRFWENDLLNLEIGAGPSLNFFGGDADSFLHVSYRQMFQGGWEIVDDTFELKVGFGFHLWPEFGANDFQPLIVDVERDSSEWTLGFFAGFDWHLF